MESIVVRDAVLDDLPVLLDFEQEIIKAERPLDPTIASGSVNYYNLSDYIADATVKVVVAQYGNEIVGSGYALRKSARHYLDHKEYAYLGFMYVLPGFRGKGINQSITQKLMEWAREQGLFEVRLTVYENNTPAIKAYEKSGFEKHLNEMRIRLEQE
ncbi:MAG: GNAT family N-acetyltransferase [Bacteroidota bacterium]